MKEKRRKELFEALTAADAEARDYIIFTDISRCTCYGKEEQKEVEQEGQKD